VSFFPNFKKNNGTIYIDDADIAAFAISADTWTKADIVTTSATLFNFTMPSDNRMTYSGVRPMSAFIHCCLSSETSATNVEMHYAIAKNGAIVVHADAARDHATAGDTGSITVSCTLNLVTNDYLEIWVLSNKNTNLTMPHLCLHADEL
jgi:hypothetical protein